MNCNCIKLVNEALEERNTCIDAKLGMNRETGETYTALEVPTAKLDPKKRGRKTILIANFCPMCGKPANPEAPDAA